MKSFKLLLLLVLLPGLLLAAYSAPQVTGLAASQCRDGSKVMDVSYALSSFENRACKVSLYYSLDGGSTWSLAGAVSGAVGEGVAPGSGKSITWRMGEELSATATGVRVRVIADDSIADLTGAPAPALTVPSDSVVFGADYTISWSAVTGATVYTLQVSRSAGFTTVDSSWALTGTSKSFKNNEDSGATLYYRVRAESAAGSGGWSAVESLKLSAFIELVSIPGGTFQMGQVGLYLAEPVHQVTLAAFQMGRYEVTQAQYQAVIGSNPSSFTGDLNRPVEMVSWYDAVTFCNKLSEAAGLQPCYNLTTWACDFTKNGYRLATEAEWEYACRAGTTTYYYTGDTESDLDKAGWYGSNSGGTTHAVGGKQANAFGLYDMHGNVWEWCNDWYDSYSSENTTDPQGPPSGSHRVSRGGSWYANYPYYPSAGRNYDTPAMRYINIGFRAVRR